MDGQQWKSGPGGVLDKADHSRVCFRHNEPLSCYALGSRL